MRFRRVLALGMAVFAIAFTVQLLPIQPAQAAVTYVVNDADDECGDYTPDYVGADELQTAVIDAIANSVRTILVCPGSYDNFTVTGATKLTIKPAIPGSFPTINAPAASSGDIILVEAGSKPSTGVVIDGLKLDGANFIDTLTTDSSGITFHNSSGTVQNSVITGIRNWPNNVASYGWGIHVIDDNDDGKKSAVVVKANNLTDVANTVIKTEGPAKTTIINTRIAGNFSGGGNPSLYGVSFMNGATGSLKNSLISDVDLGVGLGGASKVTISGNSVSANQTGVTIAAYCDPGYEVTSSNKITGNTIMARTYFGVAIYSDSSSDACVSHADSNTVSGNRIVDISAASAGVAIATEDGTAEIASANKNKVTGNFIFGFAQDVLILGATNTKVSGNTFLP